MATGTKRRKAPQTKRRVAQPRRKKVEKTSKEKPSSVRESIQSGSKAPTTTPTPSRSGKKEPVPKRRAADKKSEKPLAARRTARRADQYPEGKYNPQLMVLIRKFQCLRCGDIQNVVWSDARKKEVMKNGGLPCPRCDL